MPGVIADPNNIRQFQSQLKQFNSELERITTRLSGNLRTLNESWRDAEYHKFEQQLTEVINVLNRYSSKSIEYTRYLDKKAEPLERYQGHGG
jgi:uncharacterized protein YukE